MKHDKRIKLINIVFCLVIATAYITEMLNNFIKPDQYGFTFLANIFMLQIVICTIIYVVISIIAVIKNKAKVTLVDIFIFGIFSIAYITALFNAFNKTIKMKFIDWFILILFGSLIILSLVEYWQKYKIKFKR